MAWMRFARFFSVMSWQRRRQPPTARGSTLGVTIFDHTMSAGEDLLVMALLGGILMSAAIWAFSRQE